MKNVTLAVDEGLLERVRTVASQRGTTVNAMVREHFEQIARNESRRLEVLRELREMSEKTDADLGPNYKFNREEIYAERMFPRHERSHLRGDRSEE